MKVLLLDNVAKVGKIGDMVDVKDGYARNYMIPMGLAAVATEGQIKFYQQKLDKARQKLEEELVELKKIADELSEVEFEIEKKATDDGKLFGSVSKNDIKKLLQEKVKKCDVESLVVKTERIEKQLGKFPFTVVLGPDLEVDLFINIKKKEK